MNPEILNIGDIVSLNSHAYLNGITNIVISGEPLLLPPLMVITEIFKTKNKEENSTLKYEYKCLWFSTKLHSFEEYRIKDIHIKKIVENEPIIVLEEIFQGAMVTLKTMDYELAKQKSSSTHDDNTLNESSGNTTISALLGHVSPILHVIDIKEHESKHPLNTKKQTTQSRWVHTWDVKCFWYNSNGEKFSEITLPLEVLKLVIPVNEDQINLILTIRNKKGTLRITTEEEVFLVKPQFITFRSGYYFLKGYDYVKNAITETKVSHNNLFAEAIKPIKNSAPSFDLIKNPKAATKQNAINEILICIDIAISNNNYIRIKYKNRNEIISIRTIKDYKVVLGIEDENEYKYLIGFCCLRMAERAFRVDRISHFEVLDLIFT